MAGEHGSHGLHESGVKVYLDPASVLEMDEYAGQDPYDVETNLDSVFHRNRIALTEQLVRRVSDSRGATRLLDVGAGEGHITEHLRQIPGVVETVALEASITAAVGARTRYPHLDVIVADAYEVPYADGYFDVVVLNNIWEHVPDPLRMLAELKRVLRVGGHIVLSTPSRYRTTNLARVFVGKPVHFISPHHVTEYTVGQVREQLTYGGFDVVTVASRATPLPSLKGRTVHAVLSAAVRAVRSGHRLGPTVFFLARRR